MSVKDLVPGGRIVGLTSDSRKVQPGYLFAAIPGTKRDGRDFIPQVIAAGAVAVLAPADTDPELIGPGVSLITDSNPRHRLARLAAEFHQRQPDTMAGVTGTNGKTSVASFTRQLWEELGFRAASIGTLGLVGPGVGTGPSLTTPDPVDLHARLAELADKRIDHVVMEASSHGLEQCRLDGVRFAVAAFTNLTRDHMDYHQSMERYLAAKLRLFRELLSDGGNAVAGVDDPEFTSIQAVARERGLALLSYGFGPSDIRCVKSRTEGGGFVLDLEVLGTACQIEYPLPGRFQISNALCAMGIAIAAGAAPDRLIPLLSRLHGVPGRLQRAGTLASGAGIYVDYAHTPDALNAVLDAMRPHVAGRLHVVFGCGGDRDKGKRSQLGAIAKELADVAVITDDNPRSEDPASIRAQIMTTCRGAKEIGDRRAAIEHAIDGLEPDDVLIVAGKGHEQGQTVGDRVIPFDDVVVVEEVVAERTEQAS